MALPVGSGVCVCVGVRLDAEGNTWLHCMLVGAVIEKRWHSGWQLVQGACLWRLAVVIAFPGRGCFEGKVVKRSEEKAEGWSDCFYSLNSLCLYFIIVHQTFE